MPLVIHGDGNQTRDFVYVTDVVRHLVAALPLASAAAPISNVCRGEPISVGGLADAVMQVSNRRVPIQHEAARLGEIRHSVGSTARGKALFPFGAQVGLIDGLRELIEPMPQA